MMSNQAAPETAAKLTLPITQATKKPSTIPSRTAMLTTKPLPNLVINKIATNTTAAMRRCTGSP